MCVETELQILKERARDLQGFLTRLDDGWWSRRATSNKDSLGVLLYSIIDAEKLPIVCEDDFPHLAEVMKGGNPKGFDEEYYRFFEYFMEINKS